MCKCNLSPREDVNDINDRNPLNHVTVKEIRLVVHPETSRSFLASYMKGKKGWVYIRKINQRDKVMR